MGQTDSPDAAVLPDSLLLDAGDMQAELLPAHGAALSLLRWRGTDLVVPARAGMLPNSSFCGAFLMLPWANRLDGGRLSFAGVEYHLPINRPEDGTAIHGLARDRAWAVAARSPERAVLRQVLDEPALPFRYEAELTVAVAPAEFSLSLAVTNRADTPFPYGAGWHPFFPRPAGTHLRLRAGTVFGRDARTLPVAPRPTEAPARGIDGDEAAYLGLDTHFAEWDGAAAIRWPGGPALDLAASGAWARNLQVFAPAGAAVLCVEPVSHVPDAPNRPEFARHGAMTLLGPGESLAARLVLSVREAG
ncbi:aldose epimerase [Roseomonas sp. NAR14]|uniref:Aldose epimerase n=1 Tax=Roseomonas acroporae TaxID=2937791 RepID=A0A9X1Y9D2_9PROT|nr:aldose epimerase [Roseomonas acroporae]MCK8785871.1 aldose epimerase [Roseomonas acroporae]